MPDFTRAHRALTTPMHVRLHPEPFVRLYTLSPQGEFRASSRDGLASTGNLAGFTTTLPIAPGGPAAEFDAEQARTTAAFLLAYHRRTQGLPLEATTEIVVTPEAPTTRTRQVTTWQLPDGITLRYRALLPVRLSLEVAAGGIRWLAPWKAEVLALALLAGALELEHAHAIAGQALHADRAGETVTENLRSWLTSIEQDYRHLPVGHPAPLLIEAMRTALADEDSNVDEERFRISLGRAHGDLRAQLDAAWFDPHDTGSHEDVAWLLDELAFRHNIPLTYLTSSSAAVRAALHDGADLTEQQWTDIARTTEMRNLPSRAFQLIEHGQLVNPRAALLQAGIICRGDNGRCGALVHGRLAETWGFCAECRPATVESARARGCCGSGEWSLAHDLPAGDGTCRCCRIPLA